MGKKIACGSAALYKLHLQPYINVDLLRKLYFSIVYCHLYYAILIWGTANKTVLDSLVKLNNLALRNVCKIHTNEQISIKDLYLSTSILEINNLYKYELAKYMFMICNGIFSKEFTNEHEYKSKYHNFHTRQLDNKLLIIPLYKTVKQQRHSVYRGSKLWNEIPRDLLNIPYHTFSSFFEYKFNWFPALCTDFFNRSRMKQANTSLFLVNSLHVPLLVCDVFFLHLICFISWAFLFYVCVWFSFYFFAINMIFWLPFSFFLMVGWHVDFAVISPTLVVFLLNHAFFHISRNKLIDWLIDWLRNVIVSGYVGILPNQQMFRKCIVCSLLTKRLRGKVRWLRGSDLSRGT